MRARYAKGSAIQAGQNVDISGNEVESAPTWIVRGGISARSANTDATLQVSYVGRTFADALNTVSSSATGAVGVVPAYSLVDVSGGWTLSSRLRVIASINNVLDRQYFTKRPQFYPGPGVWPSDGRSAQLSVHVTP